jgi:hypothetical protein
MLNQDFKEFAELLNAHGVEYLVVGGYALAAHGHPRYTGDIDFWVRFTPDNIPRVLAALKDFGFSSLGLAVDDFTEDTVLQLGHPPRRIDILTAIDGVDFESCYARRESTVLGGVPLTVIGRDDFMANKKASGRPKDQIDLDALDPPDR